MATLVITGGSSGIGFEASLWSAAQGHTVLVVARNRDKLAKLEEAAIVRRVRERIHLLPADIASEEDAAAIGKEIRSRAGRIDALVNNAGLLINKPFTELGRSDWEAVYGTNVFGPVAIIRALLPALRRTKDELGSGSAPGHIVNISSMGGVQGSSKFAGLSAYSSSKAALIGVTECLAEELRTEGIHVNALALGSVQTEMFSAAFPQFRAATTPERMGEYIARFALEGMHLFNGKTLPVSASTP
jgi:NAD(P)-dependent dehydrogenase (short-subunit alcohol dehydrogenase family)